MSAGFLLFPETIEIEVDSRRKRSTEDNMLGLAPGMCGGSSAKICRTLEKILLSIVRVHARDDSQCSMLDIPQECVEVARCEVAQLSQSPEFPTMAALMRPFIPRATADRSVATSESASVWGVSNVSRSDLITDTLASLTAR